MPNPALVRKQLEDKATKIEKAGKPEIADNLRDLGEAIDGGPTADAWAYSDIRVLINPQSIFEDLHNDGSKDVIARGLEVLRNSLVLSPLAITWFGIAFAVDAYYRLLIAKPALAAQSFVFLWQSGFEGRTLLSLGTLAIIDGFLLSLVFLLTLATYARSAWVSITSQKLGSEFIAELEQALTQATLILSPLRAPQQYASIHRLEQNVQDLLNEIAAERDRLTELAQKREQETGDLSGFAAQLKQGAETIRDAAESLAQTQAANLTSVAGLTGAIQGLTDTQQDIMTAAHDVAGRIDGLIAEQQQSARDAAAQIDGLVGRIDGLVSGQQQANLDTATRFDGLVSGQQQVSQHLEQVAAEQKAASDGVIDALNVFSQSTRDLSGVGAIAQNLASEQANLIQALRDESEAQTRVAKYVSQVTANIENALTQINESSTSIRSIAADLTTISTTMPAIMNPIQVDLVNIFKEHQGTAEAISRASANLEGAVSAIEQSLQGLAPLLSAITDNTKTLADAVAALQRGSTSKRS